MVKLEHIKHIYFLGIGGIGMSALARYFLTKQISVAGYDRSTSNISISLAQESCDISYQDDPSTIPDAFRSKDDTIVIYTPAIPEQNALKAYFQERNYTLYKRSEILGLITKDMNCLAIAGTHGKTTISSLLTFILSQNKIDCTAFLGGIATDLNSNLRLGSEDLVVVEADEFDRSFLKLSPDWALISSMDADHLDIYGNSEHLEVSFRQFSDRVNKNHLIAKEGLPVQATYSYALYSSTADFSATDIQVQNGAYTFNLRHPKGICKDVVTGLPGIHNVENALAAFAMAYFQGVSVEGIVESIASFSGVKRRFECHVKTDSFVYIDDYAHHPKEITVAIQSARDLFPNEKLTVVFQPHLFTRTRDFMDDFARELSLADCVMLLEVYPAREMPISGVDSAALLEKITCSEKGLYSKSEFPDIVPNVGVLMTLGAGDIDTLVEPIKMYLTQ